MKDLRKCIYLAPNSNTVALSVFSDMPGTSCLIRSHASLILALKLYITLGFFSCFGKFFILQLYIGFMIDVCAGCSCVGCLWIVGVTLWIEFFLTYKLC